MAITTSTLTQELYSNIVQAALYTLSEQTVIRPLVQNYDMSGTPGLIAQIPKLPIIASGDLVEATDLTTETSFDTTSVEITCSEKGVLVNLTDLSSETATIDVAAAIGRQMGDGMAKKVDEDLATLFSGFSNTVGSGAAEITVNDLFKAAATLRTNQAPGPYYCILHPYQAFQIKSQLTGAGNTNMTNPSDVGNEALRSGFVGNIAGMQVFETTVVTGDSAGAFVGAAFSQAALGYVNKRPLRIEQQRDASKRSTELVCTHAYGVKEIFDQYGVGIIGDAQL